MNHYFRFLLLLFVLTVPLRLGAVEQYDTVILHGRVINPESGLDATGMNVGIRGNSVVIVTSNAIRGKQTIDATGLVVSPGFIDNLSYSPTHPGMWNKLADGVTANIDMHGGTAFPEKWYPENEKKKWPLHFGGSFFYTQARTSLGIGMYQGVTPEQFNKLMVIAENALNHGCLGVSFGLEYNPGITSNEIIPLMFLAKKYEVPVYFHTRYSSDLKGKTGVDGLEEVLRYARLTKAAVHIDHINSTGGTFMMKNALELLRKGIAEGLDITSCTYPYDYWATYLDSARFDEGWQERFHITYHDLQLGGSSERLTKESFAKYRRMGKLADAYAIPEQDVIDALRSPIVMIGSDAILDPNYNNHPRASGCFARTIGVYVRDKKVITLPEAIRKMSLMPAQRLEKRSPAMRKKGRLSPGSDADIVIFDVNTIRDMSTPEHPEYRSQGIFYVLVMGKIVLDPKGFHTEVREGIPIKSVVEK
jgi:hypothetical protein